MSPMFATVEAPAVDAHDLFQRLEDDSELLRELVTVFARRAPEFYGKCQAAYESENFMEVRQNAYVLRGMLATLSCGPAKSCALQLEQKACNADRAGVKEYLRRMEGELAAAHAALEKACMEIAA
jgi:HPt (histidine-containing phosphotransfer) domain-containing protein